MPFDQVDFVIPSPTVSDPVLDTLVKARELLSNKAVWAQGTYCAGDRFCALGAIGWRIGEDPNEAMLVARTFLRDALPRNAGGFVTAFNDSTTTTHADVLALFDRAIASRRGA